MRAVNPAVTLPYWDFTIEVGIVDNTPSHDTLTPPLMTH